MINPVRTMPQSVEAEVAVLASILLVGGADVLDEAKGAGVVTDAFYQRSHRLIWKAICDLADGMRPVDTVTVTTRLKDMGQLDECGGAVYLSKLSTAFPTAAHIKYYSELLVKKWRLRQLIERCTNALEGAYDGPEDVGEYLRRVSGEIAELDAFQGDENVLSAGCDSVLERLDKIKETQATGKVAQIGLPTGFESFDEYLGGWQDEMMIAFNAPSGQGKTALFEQFIEFQLRQGNPVTIVQKDMGFKKFVLRMACRRAGVRVFWALNGKLRKEEREKVEIAAGMLKSQQHLFKIISPARITGADFRSLVRNHHRKYGTKFFLVDHFRGLAFEGRDMVQGFVQNSREIRDAANENPVTIVILNHLKKDGDGKWCNQVEDDCDTFVKVERDGEADDHGYAKVKFNFKKNRWGNEGYRTLEFHGESMTFSEIKKEEPKQPELPI